MPTLRRNRLFSAVWVVILGAIWLSCPSGSGGDAAAGERGMHSLTASDFLIDDFSREDGRSALGTAWRMFTDRVMGGVSTAESGMEEIDGRRCLRLRGKVSLENNGGFVQVALPLSADGRSFDAGGYLGVRVWVRGNGEPYHIHLRTRDSRRPWQYYGAAFTAGESWRAVEIPFEDFKPEGGAPPLDATGLVRIAVVGIKKAFQADVAVARIEFYQ